MTNKTDEFYKSLLSNAVYNALADVAYRLHEEGKEVTEDEMRGAVEHFMKMYFDPRFGPDDE